MKYTLSQVKKVFEEYGCVLLDDEYKNVDTPLKFIAKCGHERITNFSNFKKSKQKLCHYCTVVCKGKYQINTTPISPSKLVINMDDRKFTKQKFNKLKQKMNRLYSYSLHYRNDFLPENYNQSFNCWDCKKEKNRRLFPYSKAYGHSKEKRCKSCCYKSGKYRRDNWSKMQFINYLLYSCKNTCLKRCDKGRTDCGEFDLSYDYIIDLLEKQNNKCKISGVEMVTTVNDKHKLSIDRIDSSKGYTKDNIQLVCWMVNQAKSNYNDEEFIEMCKNVYMNNKTE